MDKKGLNPLKSVLVVNEIKTSFDRVKRLNFI